MATLVVVNGYRDVRFQRSPQHRRPFRSYPQHYGVQSFKTRRSPPWDSLPPFMKPEIMMDEPPMIIKSKPTISFPPEIDIELPSIIRELPSILRKPTIIIGDKIPIIHGSSIIIRDSPPAKAPDAPAMPEPVAMMAPAAMAAPAPMVAPAAMPAPAATMAPAAMPEPTPPMAMPCSKPSIPYPGPWAEKTLSLPPEFFLSDESNHLSAG